MYCALKAMLPYIRAKFRKVSKKVILCANMMLECNLMFVGRVVLFANVGQSTNKSSQGRSLVH